MTDFILVRLWSTREGTPIQVAFETVDETELSDVMANDWEQYSNLDSFAFVAPSLLTARAMFNGLAKTVEDEALLRGSSVVRTCFQGYWPLEEYPISPVREEVPA